MLKPHNGGSKGDCKSFYNSSGETWCVNIAIV